MLILLYMALFELQEDGDMFDDYDHQMMLHGLGIEDNATCDSFVAFRKEFKKLKGGMQY